jgi:hypothetical protein
MTERAERSNGAPYRDRWIECTDDGVRIQGYYFPWGTKTIRYADIRGVVRTPLRLLRGRIRIWGTSNPRFWTSLDPKRPGKSEAFVLDTGRAVKSFLTPDDPNAFAAALAAHSVQVRPSEDNKPWLI